MNINIKNQLEEGINKEFIENKIQWINIKINNSVSIGITIVSECYISNIDLKKYVDNYLVDYNIKNKTSYKTGLIRSYTIEEAKEYEIEEPIKNECIEKFDNATFKSLSNYLDNNNIKKIPNKNNIISFYSYKGGVGRTVALIQTAYELSKHDKKILLIDLDLEAPSFNSIFKESINKEKGLVDYLYEKIYGANEKIKRSNSIIDNELFKDIEEINSINNILSKVNGLSKGEIFFIPAGKLNKVYVDRLEGLKEKRIYENQYIKNLIEEVKKQYNIDYVFIDSRTGINNWGALSLIDICDEVFLFAYPNSENIEGTKLIYDLIKDYKNTTIVISRIDNSIEGDNKALSLFQEFDINQQPILLHYDKVLALADRYPVQNLSEYNVISDYILEKEECKKYELIFKNNKNSIKYILEKISSIDTINKIHTLYEEKLNNENNCIIVCNYEDFYSYYLDYMNEELYHEICYDYHDIFKILNLSEKLRNASGIIIKYVNTIMNTKDLYFDYNTDNKLEKKCTIVLEFSKIRQVFNDMNIDLNDNIITDIIIYTNLLNINSNIYIKLIISSDDYKNYLYNNDYFNTNTLILSWEILDNVKINKDNILKNEIKEYLCDILARNIGYEISKIDKRLLNIVFDNENNYLRYYDTSSNDFGKKCFNICFGKRVDNESYSENSIDYIFDLFKSKYPLNQNGLLQFLKDHAKYELDRFDDKKDFSRLICLKDIKINN